MNIGRFATLAVLLTVTLATVGCRSNIRMPWEKEAMDASKVETREPLEIPPNLEHLPPPIADVEQPGSQPQDAKSILFGSKPTKEAKPLGRNEKEQLPDWMGGGATSSKKRKGAQSPPPPPTGGEGEPEPAPMEMVP